MQSSINCWRSLVPRVDLKEATAVPKLVRRAMDDREEIADLMHVAPMEIEDRALIVIEDQTHVVLKAEIADLKRVRHAMADRAIADPMHVALKAEIVAPKPVRRVMVDRGEIAVPRRGDLKVIEVHDLRSVKARVLTCVVPKAEIAALKPVLLAMVDREKVADLRHVILKVIEARDLR